MARAMLQALSEPVAQTFSSCSPSSKVLVFVGNPCNRCASQFQYFLEESGRLSLAEKELEAQEIWRGRQDGKDIIFRVLSYTRSRVRVQYSTEKPVTNQNHFHRQQQYIILSLESPHDSSTHIFLYRTFAKFNLGWFRSWPHSKMTTANDLPSSFSTGLVFLASVEL